MAMTASLKILCAIAVLLATVPLRAQQGGERLDSVIKALDLQEVVVTPKKIRQSGDTISYSASSYIGRDDKTLADLLRKMPGIEVRPDGQVVYNGQWINEFYIEGLDMLGSNYGVATKNIDARSIGSVEVLRDHQDVKMLQGVKRGSSPAMNIRLKARASGVWTSTVDGAAGVQPGGAWDASASLMNFRRNSQHISVAKSDNTGTDLRPEIGAPETSSPSLGTGLLLPEKPSLPDRYAYRNESHSLSSNQLVRLGGDRTLSFNLNYLYDRERRNAEETTGYLVDSVTRYVVEESAATDARQHFVGAHAVYKDNGSRRYVKNSLAAGASFPAGTGTVNGDIPQRHSGHSVTVSDALDFKYRRPGGGIADASLRISLGDTEGRLLLPSAGVDQSVRQRSFRASATTSLVAVTAPRVWFNVDFGAGAEWQRADAALGGEEPGSQHTWKASARLVPRLLWHCGRTFQLTLNVPVGVLYFRSGEGAWKYRRAFLSLTPYAFVSYRPTEKVSVDLTASCGESVPRPLSLMAQTRYSDYRTVSSNPAHVEMRPDRSLAASLAAGYTDVLGMMFCSASVSFSRSRSGVSRGYSIADGLVSYVVLPGASHSTTWQAEQAASKGFFWRKSKISESVCVGKRMAEYFVDGVPRTGESRYLRASLSYSGSPARWLTVDTSGEFSLSRAYTDGRASGGAWHTLASTTSLSVYPSSRLSLTPSVMVYHNDYSSDYRSNVFLDCRIEYDAGFAVFYARCSNLLDSRVFRRHTDNGVVSFSSEYRLRGRSVLFGIRIRIT